MTRKTKIMAIGKKVGSVIGSPWLILIIFLICLIVIAIVLCIKRRKYKKLNITKVIAGFSFIKTKPNDLEPK